MSAAWADVEVEGGEGGVRRRGKPTVATGCRRDVASGCLATGGTEAGGDTVAVGMQRPKDEEDTTSDTGAEED